MKSFSQAAVAALTMVVLAGCAGGAAEAPEPESDPPSGEAPGDETQLEPRDVLPEDPFLVPDSITAQGLFPEPNDVRICAMGDMLLGNNLDTLWTRAASQRVGYYVEPFPDPEILLEPRTPQLDDADIVLLNVEAAIPEGSAPPKCRPGSTACYAFRQPIRTAFALRQFAQPAAVVANVANNHALDAGVTGYGATIRHLRDAGIFVTGTDTLAVPVITPLGDTVGVLGFSPFVAGPDPRDLASVRRHVERAARRFPRVVVTMHMGAEGRGAQRTPDRSERFFGEDRGNSVAFAHTAVEAGAALVVGHGPHVLRAAEWVDDSLILYSLGNTLTYGPFNLREPSNRGAIACATIDARARVTSAVLRSTMQQRPGVAAADPTFRGAALVDSLGRLDFPHTGARVVHDSLLTSPDV